MSSGTLSGRVRLRTRAGLRAAVLRSRNARRIVALGRWPRTRTEAPDLAHLALYDEKMGGSLQRDEALLLHALVRVVRPKTLVEIGFFRGHSAFNFLRAMDDDSRLYAFDISPESQARAEELSRTDSRLVFRVRSQTDLSPEDIDGREADFIFLDASHDLDLNQQTFARLRAMMAPNAILAIHDTGTVPRRLLEAMDHWALHIEEGWMEDEYEVQSGERAFVNWVLESHPEFAQLHLHSKRTMRCGITLLQRAAPLARPAAARPAA